MVTRLAGDGSLVKAILAAVSACRFTGVSVFDTFININATNKWRIFNKCDGVRFRTRYPPSGKTMDGALTERRNAVLGTFGFTTVAIESTIGGFRTTGKRNRTNEGDALFFVRGTGRIVILCASKGTFIDGGVGTGSSVLGLTTKAIYSAHINRLATRKFLVSLQGNSVSGRSNSVITREANNNSSVRLGVGA